MQCSAVPLAHTLANNDLKRGVKAPVHSGPNEECLQGRGRIHAQQCRGIVHSGNQVTDGRPGKRAGEDL